MSFSISQLVNKFGLSNVSEKVRTKYNDRKFDEKIIVIHAVEPGEKLLQLRVSDGKGAAETRSFSISVSEVPGPTGTPDTLPTVSPVPTSVPTLGPFSVTITTETIGATIKYTTNDSAPSETSGQVYTGPISINTTSNSAGISRNR